MNVIETARIIKTLEYKKCINAKSTIANNAIDFIKRVSIVLDIMEKTFDSFACASVCASDGINKSFRHAFNIAVDNNKLIEIEAKQILSYNQIGYNMSILDDYEEITFANETILHGLSLQAEMASKRISDAMKITRAALQTTTELTSQLIQKEVTCEGL